MAYLDKLLASEERVLLQSRRHPLFMVLNSGPYLLGAILLWVLAVLAWVYVPEVFGVPFNVILGLALLAVSLVPLAIGAYRILHWAKEQYIITTFRILQVEGFVNRHTYDSALEKVNDVILDQSLFGRMFDYGTINIVTGSDAAINDIAGVSQPYEFKRALLEAKMAFGRWDSDEVIRSGQTQRQFVAPEPPPQQVAHPQDVAARSNAHTDRLPPVANESDNSRAIIALTELRNSGVLSDSEYAEKLRKLTGRGETGIG